MDMPFDFGMGLPDVFPLFNVAIARVCKHVRLLVMQQLAGLGDIVLIGCRGRDRVHQARIRIHADMRHHAEVPLFALPGLVHLRVSLATAVLGRARRRNQRGAAGRALPEHQILLGQGGVDRGQHLLDQTMLLEQMTDRRMLTWSGSRSVLPSPANAR